ncbi:MAG: hypothetical protein WCF68_16295 [Terriglobales bacterium]
MPLYFPKPHSIYPGAILSLILTLVVLVMCGFYAASHGGGHVAEPMDSVAFGS